MFRLVEEFKGVPGGSDGKESARNTDSIPGANPLVKGMAIHSSILAWRIPVFCRAIVHGVAMSLIWLSGQHFKSLTFRETG